MSTRPMYPVVTASSQGIAGNDSKHNKRDPNKGGGPAFRNRKSISNAQRGGTGHQGQQRTSGSMSGTPKPTASNPAGRGSSPGSMRPDVRNPNRGGGVQTDPRHRGMTRQFGTPGQRGLPSAASNPKPGRGNVGGRMHKRIAGHFNNKSKFGSMPVTEDV